MAQSGDWVIVDLDGKYALLDSTAGFTPNKDDEIVAVKNQKDAETMMKNRYHNWKEMGMQARRLV
ncbi:hypothetical protein ACFLZC_00930 [Patescibacteria group bacterium]